MPRPFLGMMFRCCNVYARIYRNPEGTAYDGKCPRCMTPVRIRIDKHAGTTRSRFFETR
ncbi:MAG: hypothetical protein ACE5FN_07995 [Leptospirillia bacterium]